MNYLHKEIEAALPTPLYDVYATFKAESEQQPFRKVHRLIDLIEVFCKIYTTATIATFLQELRVRMDHSASLNEESFNKIKVMLAAGLKTPSLGVWWMFARDISGMLQELGVPHVLPGGEEELLNTRSALFKAFNGENNLISFRNTYAHGATPSDATCKKDLAEMAPRVMSLLETSTSLQQVRLVIGSREGRSLLARGGQLTELEGHGQVLPEHSWFCSDMQKVDAYPILTFKIRESGKLDFYFYNDLKEKNASFLNYPHAEHFKDGDLREKLLQYIPIEDWRKISDVNMDYFRQLVEMLTEVFKGRKEELGQVADFIREDNRQFLCIWGAPGVGKSALLAQCTRILSYNPELREKSVSGMEWPSHRVYLVEYFIRRGSKNKSIDFFDSVNKRLDVLFNLRMDLGKSDTERSRLFEARLDKVSKILSEEEQLLLIVDGLDEIDYREALLSLLPKWLPKKIKIVFGARPQSELKFDFYEQLDRERKMQFDLGGLSKADIRAVLMEHVSKYELEQSYVDRVVQVSEGNPLYLKLLCVELEKKSLVLNDLSTLPGDMGDLYAKTIHRLENAFEGSTKFLIYLAVAKDFVSPELLAQWMGKETPELRSKFLDTCMELLFENPLTELLEDYQLFHESLREYLKETYRKEYRECEAVIADWSVAWHKPNSWDPAYVDDSLHYAMQYGADHLYESYQVCLAHKQSAGAKERRDQLFGLIKQPAWRALNFEIAGNGYAVAKSYAYAQRILSKEDAEGARMSEFLEYALNRHTEPSVRYMEQRKQLSSQVKPGQLDRHLERVPSLARMGTRAEEKIMLAMLPLWVNQSRVQPLPTALKDQVASWLETTNSPILKKLWEKSQKRFKE